jgi:MoaA/NifB/PqqE/SkfB family radical SAM enzyme
LPLTELRLDDARAIFEPAFVGQLDHVLMCGNYGDAMVAHDTLEVFRYLRSCNARMALSMHTNGSGRTVSWWAALAELGVKVTFGIDGLADTNHLYRRGTEWEHVMRSARAFIAAGGRAVWVFIVFRHNEHQVDQVRELSREMGFSSLVVKRTSRFTSGERLAVIDRNGDFQYHLELPLDTEWQHANLLRPRARSETLDTISIDCQVARRQSVYISAEALAFPCCYTGQLYSGSRRATQIAEMIAELPGGRDAIDTRKLPLRDIIEGPLFQRSFPERWSRSSIALGRPWVCAEVCGAS